MQTIKRNDVYFKIINFKNIYMYIRIYIFFYLINRLPQYIYIFFLYSNVIFMRVNTKRLLRKI